MFWSPRWMGKKMYCRWICSKSPAFSDTCMAVMWPKLFWFYYKLFMVLRETGINICMQYYEWSSSFLTIKSFFSLVSELLNPEMSLEPQERIISQINFVISKTGSMISIVVGHVTLGKAFLSYLFGRIVLLTMIFGKIWTNSCCYHRATSIQAQVVKVFSNMNIYNFFSFS